MGADSCGNVTSDLSCEELTDHLLCFLVYLLDRSRGIDLGDE